MSDGWEAAVSAPRDGQVFRVASQYATVINDVPTLAWDVTLAKFFTQGRWLVVDGEREFYAPCFWSMDDTNGELAPRWLLSKWTRSGMLPDFHIWAPYKPGQDMLDSLPR
jgi:hypothetical protein